ncbi:MAG: uncharacterized protein A8A55_0688 [Amphiamblys sp. WSBS2006]|nr:MAG: uncharacterized protein A8A55_0688 [Amphiamblys sp. WSBS2006]
MKHGAKQKVTDNISVTVLNKRDTKRTTLGSFFKKRKERKNRDIWPVIKYTRKKENRTQMLDGGINPNRDVEGGVSIELVEELLLKETETKETEDADEKSWYKDFIEKTVQNVPIKEDTEDEDYLFSVPRSQIDRYENNRIKREEMSALFENNEGQGTENSFSNETSPVFLRRNDAMKQANSFFQLLVQTVVLGDFLGNDDAVLNTAKKIKEIQRLSESNTGSIFSGCEYDKLNQVYPLIRTLRNTMLAPKRPGLRIQPRFYSKPIDELENTFGGLDSEAQKEERNIEKEIVALVKKENIWPVVGEGGKRMFSLAIRIQWIENIFQKSFEKNNIVREFSFGESLAACFSPAEDELLYFGLLRCGINNWREIRNSLLVERTQYEIYKRYKALISRSAKDNPVKKVFEELQQPLSGSEVDLLCQGVMRFGKNFDMISRYYLPNKPARHLRLLWKKIESEPATAAGDHPETQLGLM